MSEPVVATVGAPSAPRDAVGPAARTATGTAVFAVPAGAGEPLTDEPDEPVAERTTAVIPAAVSPAEETAIMEPLTDEPEEPAPVEPTGGGVRPAMSDPVASDFVESEPESAHTEEAPAHAVGEGGGTADHEPDPHVEAPTPLHSSQAR